VPTPAAPGRIPCYARAVTPRGRLLSLVVLALLVTACGGSVTTPTEGATATLDPSPTAAPPQSGAPTASADPTVAPTDAPTSAPTEQAATDAPSSEPDPAAAACSGTDANRDFFAQVADAVEWPVYCPVLPNGWFVEGGEYRLADGGWLDITYEGPDGGSIRLRQGVPCADGCVPSGTDLGEAAYGDLSGTLLDLGGGGYAVVVDRGGNPTWLLVGADLADDDVRRIAGELTLVEG
jgi:hypothetical protein